MEKGEDGYFTVSWSPLIKADKYDIHSSVPAMGGVAELYYRDVDGRLRLFHMVRSWYGGLRAVIREAIDPELEKREGLRAILMENKGRIYYRYTMSEHLDDLNDVLFFLFETFDPGCGAVEHSGRYEHIHLIEVDSRDKADF
jgi:hypothetical protein